MPGLILDKKLRVKEASMLAKIAAWKLGTRAVALVLGKTIHLHNISKNDFLQNERLVKHELCHVRQFQEHGYMGFLVKYLWESLRNGYFNNKFEVEARQAENEAIGQPEKETKFTNLV